MSKTTTSSSCDCCEGVEILTPLSVANRPGLEALSYRAGTYATFLETMKARLSGLALVDSPQYPLAGDPNPLKFLTTRSDDDPAIALLHAWANVADVLTFYQERIANEGYLRTATERRSILELARLIGYKLRPGVAASVYLAFEMEVDSDEEIPAGTGAKSTPGPAELPQTFETAEALPARYEWNGLKCRQTRPPYITFPNADNLKQLYFTGISTNLKANDPLLLVFEPAMNRAVFRRIQDVELEVADERTRVTLQTEDEDRAALIARIDAIRGTVARYQNLEAFRVTATTQMAQRVTELLANLENDMETAATVDAVAACLAAALPPLHEEHAIAAEGAYGRLEPWVGGLAEEITAHEAALLHSMPARTAGLLAERLLRRREFDGNDEFQVDPRLQSLVNLVQPLTLAPSAQPANAQRLQRNLRTFFNPASDTVPRLLTRLKPGLKGTLYEAWGNTQLTFPSALESAQALRVKAAPFGHNAPLRPIYDDQGAIITHEEWPLNDLKVSLRFNEGDQTNGYNWEFPFEMTLATTRHGQTVNEFIRLETEPTGPVVRVINGITFSLSFNVDDEEIMDINIEVMQRQISMDINGSSVFITIEPLQPFQISRGSSRTAHDSANGDTFQLFYSESSQLSLYITPGQMNVPEPLRHILPLDLEYNEILPNSWVVIQRPDPINLAEEVQLILQVLEARTVSKVGYGITGKVTELTLDGNWLFENDRSLALVRQTTVFAQSEPLILAEEPLTDDVQGDQIELDRLYDGLEAGRWVIVSGERTDVNDASGVQGNELMMLAAVTHGVYQVEEKFGLRDLPGDSTHTTITFPKPLAYTYKRDSVTIYGNVVKATHGETRTEVLGGGDGSRTFQTFGLSHSPLTFISAPTPAGAETTLSVRVNDVRWPEAEDLFMLGPTERGFITRADDDAKTSVIFGDGRHGSRLPTGAENVKAVYRNGIGKPGNVVAAKINQLAAQPLGIKGVINPLPATGGADKEDRDQARGNAPLAVMALDRLVSVRDYADFARTFAGVGKAQAVRCTDGHRELVHLTIAGVDDIPIDTSSDLYRNLCQALHNQGDPYQPIRVDLRELVVLVISAKVRLLPEYLWEVVEAAVRDSLLTAYSFNGRDLGQDVLLSEVISLIQHVPGVAYVDVDVLEGIAESTTDDAKLLQQKLDAISQSEETPPRNRIVVQTTCAHPGPIQPAQLAVLQPDLPETLILTELT